VYKFINIVRINCAPSWLYLQDYREMHGQQNVQFDFNQLNFSHQSKKGGETYDARGKPGRTNVTCRVMEQALSVTIPIS